MLRYGAKGLRAPKKPPEVILATLTHDILMKKLVEYGNDPNYKQEISLSDLCFAYELIMAGHLNGWYTFPMPVGGGKTLSIVALCKALSDLPGLYKKSKADSSYEDVSILVCASKVETLCQLKRDLVEAGVPKEWIGLYHSYDYHPQKKGQPNHASEPRTGDYENKRILLTTHQRVSGKWGAQHYRLYKGNPRSLVIYDESLIKAEAMVVQIDWLSAGEGFYKVRIANKNYSMKAKKAVEYIATALEKADQEMKAQINEARRPEYIILQELTMEEIEGYKKELAALGEKEKFKAVYDFLDMSQEPLRVLQTNQGKGFITYDLKIDPELENMIILDASYLIRDLVKRYDREIRHLANQFDADYSNLTLHRIPIYSGRHTIEEEFGKPENKRKITKEIAHIIKQIPENEGILIFTYKHDAGKPDIEKILKDDLKHYGVDLEAKLPVEIKPGLTENKTHINFLTWGQETSLNDYSWIKNQIQVGILHMSHLNIGAWIAGQSGDPLMRINAQEIREVVKSEVVHCFYQALGRTHCRIITGGKAGRANVWYTDVDMQIWETLRESGMLKNSQCKEWPLRYMGNQDQKRKKIGFKIMDYLNALPVFVEKISVRQIKYDLELGTEASKTVQRAIDFAVEQDIGWKKVSRSLVRIQSENL
jgi:hypothetical protein